MVIMISKEDLNGINFDRLLERREEFEKYNGMLPVMIFDCVSITNHYKHISEEVKQVYNNRREMYVKFNAEEACEFEKEELVKRINDNPEFEDILL